MIAGPTAHHDMTGPAPTGGAGPVPFVVLAIAISWAIWLVGWLAAGRPDTLTTSGMAPIVFLGSFGPTIAAAILSRRASRVTAGLWARGFLRWRMGWRSAAIVAVALPLAVILLTVLLGYTPKPRAGQQGGVLPAYLALFPISVLLGAFAGVLGPGPLGEEGGWRGYLLPRLLLRRDALASSVLIGLAMLVWSAPVAIAFPDARMAESLALFLPVEAIRLIALSYIATTVWRLSNGSLVACVWLRGMVLALAGMAFVPSSWTSGWHLASGLVPFTLAMVLVAIVLGAIQRRRTGAY